MPLHRLPRAPLAAAVAIFLLAQAPARAAEAPAAAPGAPGVEATKDPVPPEPTDLGRVEVVAPAGIYATRSTRSATRTDTLLLDVPQSVTIVNEQLMRDQRMQGMADVV